ncbi:MAG: hypothetical protein P8J33_13705 [Pirellulaceae bacterium]|nr:hypothetical protein [Pirellulaceae bacterium]
MAAAIAFLLAAIAGLNLLHLNSPDWIEVIGEEGVAALSLNTGRGLGVWYSNFLLLLSSCVSLQIFLLRQHRRDDYRGSYRIWMWLAVLFLLASAASVTGIASLFRNVIANTLGSGGAGNSTLMWVFLIKLGGLLLLLVRGLIEVRHSKLAVVGLFSVLFAYGIAHLINEVPEVQAKSSEYLHASLGNSLLFGSTALFVSVLGYARFVYLNANGLVKARATLNTQESQVSERSQRKQKARQEKLAAKQAKLEAKELQKKEKADEREAIAAEKSEARTRRRKEAALDEEAERVATKTKKDSSAAKKTAASAVKKKQKSTKTQTTNGTTKRKKTPPTDAPLAPLSSKMRTKTKATPKPKTSSQPVGDDYLLTVEAEEVDGLSKADRRRLKKLKRRAEKRAA